VSVSEEAHRQLDLCRQTDILFGDKDGLYHPVLFNDRPFLRLKKAIEEAKIYVRGIKNSPFS